MTRLTFYLRDVFGGNSRTTVITNVLNESSYYFETWNTLRFAAKAKSIKVSPKANFDTEGSEEALKQEIDRLLRKIDLLEKNQHGPVQASPVNNQLVIKLVDRLEHAWDNVINGIEERQLLFKEAISKADEYFINLIMEFRQCLVGRGSEILLKSKFLPILEEMEEFFGQNWNGLGPREVIDKLQCFHEIVKDEIKALKGVVQSKPQTARDKLKRIKKRWQNSLERIDEIMSDEEEEKQIINGLLSCMDEPTAAPETPQQNPENPDDLSQLEKRFTWGAPEGQPVKKESKQPSYGELEVNRNLIIDLTSINKQQQNEPYFGKEIFDVDQSVTNKTGRPSSSRAKDIKMAEVQELLSQFTPQRIRMVIKENDLLNKKIQKQRFLILEMKKKMDEVEEQRATKTHRLNRSCDDIPTSLLGNLEKVVDESVTPWNENEIKQFDSIYDDRKSMHWRRSTNKPRQSNHVVPVLGESIQVLLEDDIKINSPHNEMAESIREILSQEDLQQRYPSQILANGKSSLKIEESKKAELMSNLFDPAKRFQPTSHQQWRDTAFARDSMMPDAYHELPNPIILHEERGDYQERLSEGVLVESPHKDPFSHDVLEQYGTTPEKYKVVSESPGVFKQENQRIKSDLETLSKRFKDLEEQKAKLEKRLTVSDGPKDSRVNFSKNKTTIENEIVASERLNSQIVQDPSSRYRSKPISNPAKISLFGPSQPQEVESRSNRNQINQENRHYKHREENTYTPVTEAPSFGKQQGPSTVQIDAWPTSQIKMAMVSPSYKTDMSSKYTEETPPRIVTDFMPEDSMRRSNNDEELKALEALLSEKNKETIGYLKLIEKLQKENDHLRETTEGGSSLGLYKLKLENKKLKEAIKKIAGKVKREIDSDKL